MSYDHKKVDKIGKIVVDSLLLVLLWALLALPASTFSLLKLDTSQDNVLSGQSSQGAPAISPYDESKTVREPTSNTDDMTNIVRP